MKHSIILTLALLATLVTFTIAQTRVVTGYDLHVYFFDNAQSKAEASKLMQDSMNRWGSDLRIVMFPKPVGPHILPMFELDIPQTYPYFSDIVSWIMVSHGNLSALLHPHTGDELYDHTKAPFWLGQPVPLDLTKL